MAVKKSLLDAVRSTVHNGKITADEIADSLDVSANLVYRMALEETGDGFLKHLRRAVNLMNLTKNYSILETMAAQCGGFFQKKPRTPSGKPAREMTIAEFNLEYAHLLKSFAEFLKEPSSEMKNEFFRMVDDHLRHVAFMKKQAEKHKNQTTIFDLLGEN